MLISHEEADIENAGSESVYKIIKPEPLSFISYPYEWCFSQLKDAALTTLKIQKEAVGFSMSLKDCSAYNIQFRNGKPIFIDTLSFERYREGDPWVAYAQFCGHFIAPLALMSYQDMRLNRLSRIFMDGIPLDLTSSLLPFRSYFDMSLLFHIHLHSKSQKYFADKTINIKKHRTPRVAFLGLIDTLESAIRDMKPRAKERERTAYYESTNYSSEAFQNKKDIVAGFLNKIDPKNVWDFGSNTCLFSRMACERGIQTIAFDFDPLIVESNYVEGNKNGKSDMLPLVLDLMNPSPAIGWDNHERMSLFERGPADTVFALALLHHLAISNNVPLERIAGFFDKICRSLIIEFVPKKDSQVQRLLANRRDIFYDYTPEAFEREFGKYFIIRSCVKIKDSERSLYLMQKKQPL